MVNTTQHSKYIDSGIVADFIFSQSLLQGLVLSSSSVVRPPQSVILPYHSCDWYYHFECLKGTGSINKKLENLWLQCWRGAHHLRGWSNLKKFGFTGRNKICHWMKTWFRNPQWLIFRNLITESLLLRNPMTESYVQEPNDRVLCAWVLAVEDGDSPSPSCHSCNICGKNMIH